MASRSAENRRIELSSARAAAGVLLISEAERPLLCQGRLLSDEDLLAKLASCKIAIDRGRLLKVSRQFPSAETLAHWLIKEDHADLGAIADADHWIWISIVCLWQRWCVNRPCLESFDDSVHAGYERLRPNSDQACQIWCKSWQSLQLLLKAFRFASIDDLDETCPGTYPIRQWVLDFVAALGTFDGDLHWAATRLVVAQQAFALFELAPSSTRILPALRNALAEAHFSCGDRTSADRWFEKCVELNPDPVTAWVLWSAHYLRPTILYQPGRAEVLARRGLRLAPPGRRHQLLEIIARVCEGADRRDEATNYLALAAVDVRPEVELTRAA